MKKVNDLALSYLKGLKKAYVETGGEEVWKNIESVAEGASENDIVIKGVQDNADKFTYADEDFELAEDGDGNLILQVPDTAPEHKNHGADGTGTITGEWQAWDPQTTPTISRNGYYYLDENLPTNSERIGIYKCW